MVFISPAQTTSSHVVRHESAMFVLRRIHIIEDSVTFLQTFYFESDVTTPPSPVRHGSTTDRKKINYLQVRRKQNKIVKPCSRLSTAHGYKADKNAQKNHVTFDVKI